MKKDNKPTCMTCIYWRVRKGQTEQGDCKLNPVEVAKVYSDYCGQHKSPDVRT